MLHGIVDAEQPCIEQYLLEDGDYHLAIKSSTGRLQCRVIGGLEFSVEALFDESNNLSAIRDMLVEG